MDNRDDFHLCTLRMPEAIRPYVAPLLLISVLLAVIYANSFNGTWIFDDAPNILENEHVHVKNLDFESLKNSIYGLNGNLNRPLAFLTFGINYYFGQTDVFGYHVVNFSIHLLASFFLFLLIVKTLNLPGLREAYAQNACSIALLATVFWAVNPVQVTAVTYIVQRMASMAGLFYVMCMYFYVLGRTSEKRTGQSAFFAISFACALLGLASKQNAAMLPVSIFLYDLFLIQGVSRESIKKNAVIAAAPLGILLVAGFIYTDFSAILGGYENRPFTLAERLLTQPRIIFFYLSQLFYPVDSRLTLVHEVAVSTGMFSPVTTFLSILAIACAAVFAFLWSQRFPLACFSVLFFLANHVIEGTFVPLELIYEHRNYIPSFFLFVPLSILIVRAIRYFSYRRALQGAIVLVVTVTWIGQGHTVYMRNQRFSDPAALWADNAQKAPGLSRVHINLGNAYFEKEEYERAYECYEKAQEADYFHNIGNEGILHYHLSKYHFHVTGDLEKSRHHAETARTLYPGNVNAWYYSALVEIGLGNFRKAEEIAAPACKRWPENDRLHYVYGLAMLKQEKFEECSRIASEALAKDLARGRFYKLKGIVYLQTGKFEAAARLLNLAIEKLPTDNEMMLATMELYLKTGDLKGSNRIALKLLTEKGDMTWEDYINNAARENALNAYEIDTSMIEAIQETVNTSI